MCLFKNHKNSSYCYCLPSLDFRFREHEASPKIFDEKEKYLKVFLQGRKYPPTQSLDGRKTFRQSGDESQWSNSSREVFSRVHPRMPVKILSWMLSSFEQWCHQPRMKGKGQCMKSAIETYGLSFQLNTRLGKAQVQARLARSCFHLGSDEIHDHYTISE
mgnify:CR=1 FL=1